jgi:hypothetical protein
VRRNIGSISDADKAIVKLKKLIEANEFRKDRAERSIKRDEYQIQVIEQRKLKMIKNEGDALDQKNKSTFQGNHQNEEKQEVIEPEKIPVRKKTSLFEDLFSSGGE